MKGDVSDWRKMPVNAHRWKRHEADYYPEPPEAVRVLLDVERVHGRVWDPCCGGGNIPRTLNLGSDGAAFGTDMVDRGLLPRDGWRGVHEFLGNDPPPFLAKADIIFMNPPFQLAQRFIEKSLTIATWKVIALARLAFLESETRAPFFERVPLARVWIFPWRVSMPPGEPVGSTQPAERPTTELALEDYAAEPVNVGKSATGGKVAFAWFVFEKGYVGRPQIGWLKRRTT